MIFIDVKSMPTVSLDSDRAKMTAKSPQKASEKIKNMKRLNIPEVVRQYEGKVSDTKPEENEESENVK